MHGDTRGCFLVFLRRKNLIMQSVNLISNYCFYFIWLSINISAWNLFLFILNYLHIVYIWSSLKHWWVSKAAWKPNPIRVKSKGKRRRQKYFCYTQHIIICIFGTQCSQTIRTSHNRWIAYEVGHSNFSINPMSIRPLQTLYSIIGRL